MLRTMSSASLTKVPVMAGAGKSEERIPGWWSVILPTSLQAAPPTC